jgi:hypothetical protein
LALKRFDNALQNNRETSSWDDDEDWDLGGSILTQCKATSAHSSQAFDLAHDCESDWESPVAVIHTLSRLFQS